MKHTLLDHPDLIAALCSVAHDEADVRRRLAIGDVGALRPLLAGVRAEDESRFWASLRVFFAHTWSPALAGADADRSVFALVAAPAFRDHGALEHACDHFCYQDLQILYLASDTSADLPFDLVRAVEVDDRDAAARVVAKLNPMAHVRLWSLASSPSGALRVYEMFASRFRGDVRAELSWLAANVSSSRIGVAWAAHAIGRRLGVPLDELTPLSGNACGSAARLLLCAAHAVDPSLARELVLKLVDAALVEEDPLLVDGLPWQEVRGVATEDQVVVGRRLEELTVLARVKRQDGVSKGNPRWSAKRHPNAAKAASHIDKKLAEAAAAAGAPVEPWPSTKPGAHPAAALVRAIRSGRRGWALELLAAGASGVELVDGRTALHEAVRVDAELVRRILATGADPNTRCGDATPLDFCTGFNGDTLRVAHLLVDAGGRALHRWVASATAENGSVGLVPLLARAGVDLRSPLPGGRTPVEHAEAHERWRTAAALRSVP